MNGYVDIKVGRNGEGAPSRGGKLPAPKGLARGFKLWIVRIECLPINHLAVIVYEESHMNRYFRTLVLRRADDLGGLDLAQKITLRVRRQVPGSHPAQSESQFDRGYKSATPSGRGERRINPSARRFQSRRCENRVAFQYMNVSNQSPRIDRERQQNGPFKIIDPRNCRVVGYGADQCQSSLFLVAKDQGVVSGTCRRILCAQCSQSTERRQE